MQKVNKQLNLIKIKQNDNLEESKQTSFFCKCKQMLQLGKKGKQIATLIKKVNKQLNCVSKM